MIVELLPIGTWSILYTNLKYRSDKKNISDTFKLSPIECGSCLHTLTYIRNLCAHNSRLWNRHFICTFMGFKSTYNPILPLQHKRLCSISF
ncbi:Abi family protein [Legionella sainthelensi]|uniref:Abi family protein n=1 Tax=Legionella sainthelensi TaxID=28087 RepID=UPI0009DCD529